MKSFSTLAQFSLVALISSSAVALASGKPETCIVTEISGKHVNAQAIDLTDNSAKSVELQLLTGTQVILKNEFGWMKTDGQLFSTVSVTINDKVRGSAVESMIRIHRSEDDGQLDENLSRLRYSPVKDSRIEISCTQIK